MGLRDTLNKHPALTAIATLVVIVIGIAFVIHRLANDEWADEAASAKFYYTSDDGNNYIAAHVDKQFADFKIDGREAVLARVYRCRSSGQQFVGYLERYTADAKSVIQSQAEQARKGNASSVGQVQTAVTQGREVKRPGEASWVRYDSKAGIDIREVKCKDGKNDAIEVWP